jgi:hypothetical protein
LNEAKALCGVEPLHSAVCHDGISFKISVRTPARA